MYYRIGFLYFPSALSIIGLFLAISFLQSFTFLIHSSLTLENWMEGSSNPLPIGQSARGSSKDTEATVRRKIGKRYIRLPGQRGVLSQRRGVREPCYTYTLLRPRDQEIIRLSCFIAFHTSRFSSPTHHPENDAPSLPSGISRWQQSPWQGQRHQSPKPPAVEHHNREQCIIG